MLDNQLKSAITEQIADIKNTEKGSQFTKNDGTIGTLADSKDVAKRKKELRSAINVNCRSALKSTNNQLNDDIKQNKVIKLSGKDAKNFVGNLSLGIANFVEGITGSSRIKDIVYNFSYFYIGDLLISNLKEPKSE